MAGDNFNKILNGIYLDFEYVQSNDGNLEIRKWKKRKLVHTNVNNTNKQSLPFAHCIRLFCFDVLSYIY